MREELMRDCLQQMGVSFTEEQMRKLAEYDRLLLAYNPSFKMVKAEGDEFVIRHYADTLAAVPMFKDVFAKYKNPVVADLGSGAGLPGVPLSIAFPDIRFVLVERMEKRANFLRMVIRCAGLSNARVEERRLVEVKDHYDIVTCRAFHPFYDIESEVDSVLAPGGTVVLYKGRRESINEEFSQVKGAWHFTAKSLKVPYLDAQRAVLVGTRKESWRANKER